MLPVLATSSGTKRLALQKICHSTNFKLRTGEFAIWENRRQCGNQSLANFMRNMRKRIHMRGMNRSAGSPRTGLEHLVLAVVSRRGDSGAGHPVTIVHLERVRNSYEDAEEFAFFCCHARAGPHDS